MYMMKKNPESIINLEIKKSHEYASDIMKAVITNVDFKLNGKSFELRLLEKAVAFRSTFLQKPYGDQGLLIHRSLYEKTGGFSSLCIMEDIDFILKLKKVTKIRSLGIPLFTNATCKIRYILFSVIFVIMSLHHNFSFVYYFSGKIY